MLYSVVVQTEGSIELVAVDASSEEEARRRAERLLPGAGRSRRVVAHREGSCVYRFAVGDKDAEDGAGRAPFRRPLDPFLR